MSIERVFKDGVRVLDADEVVAVYEATGRRLKRTAAMLGTTIGKVRPILEAHGIDCSGLVELDSADVLNRYDATRSVKRVAAELKVSPPRIVAILEEAGIERKTFSTAKRPTAETLIQLHRRGHTLEQIAAQVGWSYESVRRWLREANIDTNRPRTVTDDQAIINLYVQQRKPVSAIAKQFGVSPAVVTRILKTHSVKLRSRTEALTRADPAEIERLFHQGLTPEEISPRVGLKPGGVRTALSRMGLKRETKFIDVAVDEVEAAYIAGLSDLEIATQLGVSAWTINQLRREHGIDRKWWDYPPPDSAELAQIAASASTIVEISTHYRVPAATAKRWLTDAGLPLPTTRKDTGHPKHPKQHLLDRATLQTNYVEKEQSTDTVAELVGASKRLVVAQLHREALPVRKSGNGGRETESVLIDKLRLDPTIQRVCAAHSIALDSGQPVELTPALLTDLYVTVGLSQLAISLITNRSETSIRAAMQVAGIKPRGAGRSPWRST
jgi:transposase